MRVLSASAGMHYNIEFAHIYVNEDFTSEHRRSAAVAARAAEEVKARGDSCALSVLIDDYNPTDNLLDIEGFIGRLTQLGVPPDYVVMESRLARCHPLLLSQMINGASRFDQLIRARGKVPCSFLISIWHLLRLGLLSSDGILETRQDKPFVADRLITILPRRYESVEKKALDIIRATRFSESAEQMESIFF